MFEVRTQRLQFIQRRNKIGSAHADVPVLADRLTLPRRLGDGAKGARAPFVEPGMRHTAWMAGCKPPGGLSTSNCICGMRLPKGSSGKCSNTT